MEIDDFGQWYEFLHYNAQTVELTITDRIIKCNLYLCLYSILYFIKSTYMILKECFHNNISYTSFQLHSEFDSMQDTEWYLHTGVPWEGCYWACDVNDRVEASNLSNLRHKTDLLHWRPLLLVSTERSMVFNFPAIYITSIQPSYGNKEAGGGQVGIHVRVNGLC